VVTAMRQVQHTSAPYKVARQTPEGLLRYIVVHHGHVFAHGATATEYFRVLPLVMELAAITQEDPDLVISQIQRDYAVLEDQCGC